MLGIVLRDIAV